MAGRSLIEHKLRKMFDYRHEMTSRIVASGDFSGATSASGSRAAGAEGRSPADAWGTPAPSLL